MIKDGYRVRTLKSTDIEAAMKLSVAEGWNQTEKDWAFMIDNAANYCIAAEWDNHCIGTAIAINYSDSISWIAMVLVDKRHRRQGVSKMMLQHLLHRLEDFKSIKLDATPAGSSVYTNFGFEEEYTIHRMVRIKSMEALTYFEPFLIPIESGHDKDVINLDALYFGTERHLLINYLIGESPASAWMIKNPNKISGFILGRNGNLYFQIGPLIASSLSDAKTLMTRALASLSDQNVVIDVWCMQKEFIDWLLNIGFVQHRQFIRMYKNSNPDPLFHGNKFLIAGPEFG